MKNQKKTVAVQEKAKPAINRKLALVLYMMLAVVSAALLVMTILASAGVRGVWNGMPIVAVLSIFGVALAVSVVAFNPKKTFYSVGFYVSHSFGFAFVAYAKNICRVGPKNTIFNVDVFNR